MSKPGGSGTSWRKAHAHLRKADPVLARIIVRSNPCALSPRRDYFVVLCRAIFSQQLSTKVSAVIFGRFRKLFPQQRPTPARVLALSDEQLRGVGLSRQKMAYIRDLARHFASGEVESRKFAKMGDEQIITSLTRVKGVGRWTVEMFLIFVLNRPDLLPVDDLGLRKGVQRVYGLGELPTAKQVVEIAEKWRPYRSVATWYMWRGQ